MNNKNKNKNKIYISHMVTASRNEQRQNGILIYAVFCRRCRLRVGCLRMHANSVHR